ncbi:unnamed protein product [Aphanomyces euteiches]
MWRFIRVAAGTCLLTAASAFECDPSAPLDNLPSRKEGEECGGWCGSFGTCEKGLHCDVGLFPLALLAWGSPLPRACRNPSKDNLLWNQVSSYTCSSPSNQLNLSDDSEYEIISNAVQRADLSVVLHVSTVRVLTAKKCGQEYAILLERVENSHDIYLLTQGIDGTKSTVLRLDTTNFRHHLDR